MFFGQFSDSPPSRRQVVIGAGMTASSALLVPNLIQSAAAAVSPTMPRFDFNNPAEMLKLYVKMNSSLAGEPVYGWYSGHAFGVMPDQIIEPLFGFEGFGCGWTKAQPDGTYQSAYKEVGYYKDLKSGEIIEQWTNPYTNEKCDVMHIHNASVNMTLKPQLPDYTAAAKNGVTIGNPNFAHADDPNRPYGFPYAIAGDTISIFNDARGYVPNRLDPKVWPRESTGKMMGVAEFFVLTGSATQALDTKTTNIAITGAWTRIAPWLPWMIMGGKPGQLFYRSATKKLGRLEDVPEHIISYTAKRYPEFLKPPTDFNVPMESSWDVYKRERKPKL